MDPRKGLFNIKAEKVVRFLFFKVNTNKFVFLKMDSLITITDMIYYICYACVI